jgi:predicted porin
MKKFLLGTTALISLSAASAAMAGGSHTPAAAEPANTGGLTVLVGGSMDFQSVFRNEDREIDGGNVSYQKNEIFRNDTILNFTAAGSTDSFDYGAVIELAADTNNDKNGDDGGRKTYLYVENDSFGRVEGGVNVGASSTLEVDASTIARGSGGVDGDILYNMDTDALSAGSYITSPNLPTADEETDEGNATKLTYYTPRFSGVQFGVSFTPDTGNRGSADDISDDGDNGDYSNVFAGGLNFQSDIADGVGIMASAVAEFGTAEGGTDTVATNDDREDLSAYSLGLGFEFEGFSVAGNYADLGDSGQDTTPTAGSDTDQAYYTVGAAYENGPYGVSVTYLNSQAGNAVDPTQNELSNLVIGADYQMAPGLTPYIEYANFELDEQGTANDSDGSVVLVGAELSF